MNANPLDDMPTITEQYPNGTPAERLAKLESLLERSERELRRAVKVYQRVHKSEFTRVTEIHAAAEKLLCDIARARR